MNVADQPSQVPKLQDICANLIRIKWENIPLDQRKQLCDPLGLFEPIRYHFVQETARMNSEVLFQQLMASCDTLVERSAGYQERLALLGQLSEKIALAHVHTKMRDDIENWCNRMEKYLNLPEDTRFHSGSDPKLVALEWAQKQPYLDFPRPFCASQRQIDQIIDISNRVEIQRYLIDSAFFGSNNASQIICTFQIALREASPETIYFASKIKQNYGSDHARFRVKAFEPESDLKLLQNGAPSTLTLTFQYFYALNRSDDVESSVLLRVGSDPTRGFDFFMFQYDTFVRDEYGPVLTALKLRLLDGAPPPTAEGPNSSLSDEQFMTLLLLCAQGHDQRCGGTNHLTHFVGYFNNDDHIDDSYEE